MKGFAAAQRLTSATVLRTQSGGDSRFFYPEQDKMAMTVFACDELLPPRLFAFCETYAVGITRLEQSPTCSTACPLRARRFFCQTLESFE
jgi:hypothetical protein